MTQSSMTPRAISSHEEAVLRQVLTACPTQEIPASVLHSLTELKVVNRCGCGCDTVEFEGIDWKDAPEVLGEGLGVTPGGRTVGVLAFGSPERILCLEVYSLDDEIAKLPVPESIRPGKGLDDASV